MWVWSCSLVPFYHFHLYLLIQATLLSHLTATPTSLLGSPVEFRTCGNSSLLLIFSWPLIRPKWSPHHGLSYAMRLGPWLLCPLNPTHSPLSPLTTFPLAVSSPAALAFSFIPEPGQHTPFWVHPSAYNTLSKRTHINHQLNFFKSWLKYYLSVMPSLDTLLKLQPYLLC